MIDVKRQLLHVMPQLVEDDYVLVSNTEAHDLPLFVGIFSRLHSLVCIHVRASPDMAPRRVEVTSSSVNVGGLASISGPVRRVALPQGTQCRAAESGTDQSN